MRGLPELEKNLHLKYPAILYKDWRKPKQGVKLILKYFLAYEGCLFDLGNLIDALGQHHLGYHFAEWWTAIELLKKYRLLSLVEKYAGRFPTADLKRRRHWRLNRFQEVIPDDKTRRFLKNGRLTDLGNERLKLPDLLVYTPDKGNYAFVEVKRARDSLTPLQKASFQKIEKRLNKDVSIACLKEA